MKYTFPWRIFSVVLTDAGIQAYAATRTTLRLLKQRRAFDRVQRRLLDLSAALVLLTLCAPVMVWIAAVIKLSTPDRYFIVKSGLAGAGDFEIWKFRTMFTGPQSGPCVTAQDDDRITPLGKHLRSWKLDELPQLFNVVHGEMSLVGPRPQVPRFVDCFDAQLRRIILSVRPGMTGPTALYFRHEEFLLAGKTDREHFYITHLLPIKMRMDAKYVPKPLSRSDLRIFADTLHLVVSRLTGHVGNSGIPAVCDLAELNIAEDRDKLVQTAEPAYLAAAKSA